MQGQNEAQHITHLSYKKWCRKYRMWGERLNRKVKTSPNVKKSMFVEEWIELSDVFVHRARVLGDGTHTRESTYIRCQWYEFSQCPTRYTSITLKPFSNNWRHSRMLIILPTNLCRLQYLTKCSRAYIGSSLWFYSLLVSEVYATISGSRGIWQKLLKFTKL